MLQLWIIPAISPYSDEHPDPSPDCVAVKRIDGGFIVTHYPHIDAEKPCCRPVRVRARAGEDEQDTLRRAHQLVEQQHARAAAEVA
jgi:hypothetical protein